MRNLSVFRFSFQIKENFCADFNFLQALVGSYKIFEIGCNVAKPEKYPQIELRLSIIIMIMHNGLKISANVIFEKMKSFYPPVLQLEPLGPQTTAGFFQEI